MTGVSDGFHWKDEPWGRSLRSATLAGLADHLFTTCQLRLRGGREAEEWAAVGRALGVDGGRVARLKQVHGREVVVLKGGAAILPDAASRPHADIVATDDPSLAIAVQVADCVPLLMAGPGGRVVAAVHAGWRGTCAAAAVGGVEALEREFGARPADLVVAVGPSIGPCCYIVGGEVLEQFEAAHENAARWFRRDGDGRLRLDLWAANADQLEDAGVPRASIRVSRLCTACHPGLFHSYRRDGPGTGRIAAAIRARGCGP
ncbi:MAG: peptidoglycan editing factor PgeF [Acidobacteria bacterium]|nr:peptidoglycan editing factor PgeF [Acidobacteriota bacterium]